MGKPDLRIVLLGKTGVGKSATGNTILGIRDGFEEKMSSKSVTKDSASKNNTVSGRDVLVADTPGLFDTKLTNDELKGEIARCVHLTVPGPHVFLLVLRLTVRYTEEEQKTMQWIEKNFSKDALRYAMVLFTEGDRLCERIEDFINENEELVKLVAKCGGGYHVFNNTNRDVKQVTDLLEKIDKMVMKNGGDHYTDHMYLEAQRKIEEEKERVRMEEERKREEKKRVKMEEERKRQEEEKARMENERKQHMMQVQKMREDWERSEKEARVRREQERREEERVRKEEEGVRREEERVRREEDNRQWEKKLRKVEEMREKERLRREEERREEERVRREEERERREEEKRQLEEKLRREKKRAEEEEKARKLGNSLNPLLWIGKTFLTPGALIVGGTDAVKEVWDV